MTTEKTVVTTTTTTTKEVRTTKKEESVGKNEDGLADLVDRLSLGAGRRKSPGATGGAVAAGENISVDKYFDNLVSMIEAAAEGL